MTWTTTMREAMVADVEAVTGLVTFAPAPTDLARVQVPSAYMWPVSGGQGGDTEGSTVIGAGQGEAAQRWALRVFTADGADAAAEAETFLDRIRNAVENPSSALMQAGTAGVGAVMDAAVEEWRTEFQPGEDAGRGLVITTCIISAAYWYARGSI